MTKIVCLGKEFNSEEERREFFRNELRAKIPELKRIEGFPIGEDEDIINLSDPPYYTACPNPWLNEVVSIHDDNYAVKTPYSEDMQVNDRHPVYSYHPYHTKVPPSIISDLIKYYTKTNDVVLDIFSGSGMTGVAGRENNRKVILIDLSTVATFISGINTTTTDAVKVVSEVERIVAESKKEYGWVYKTKYGSYFLDVNYFVWSDVFTCPNCVHEFSFFPTGVIHHGNKVETRKSFHCPSCNLELNVRKIERVITTYGKKRKLVWTNAGTGRNRINREASDYDLEISSKVEAFLLSFPKWYPKDSINPEGYSAKLAQLGNKNLTDISRFLSDRNLIVYSDLWDRMLKIEDTGLRNAVRSILTSIFTVVSERQGYFGGGGGMSGNLYMPIVRMEKNIYATLIRKIESFKKSEIAKPKNHNNHFVSTQSATDFKNINDSSVDYIYTDPPFGANIIYSEMNLLLEGWLRVKTNNYDEAVIDETASKDFNIYGNLMRKAFAECFRVLKPGRWMSVEFHNTQASVWNLIQTAINESGFVIAQVNKLDKGSTTILADIRPGAAVQDLIISCYKPTEFIDRQIINEKANVLVWDFLLEHLGHLPIHLIREGKTLMIIERTPKILFDRVVTFYLMKGLPVPVDVRDFQEGLRLRFVERDGMYFTVEQAVEYDEKKAKAPQFMQLSLIVTNESDAIEWLKDRLRMQAQKYQDIMPDFRIATQSLRKGDTLPELQDILNESFIQETDGKWRTPDPNEAKDREALRSKVLLKEFTGYVTAINQPKAKKLKEVRVEALRAGFKNSWEQKDFKTIVTLGDMIPQNILLEDEQLLMYYDIAKDRI
jgi:DNA modification methylase